MHRWNWHNKPGMPVFKVNGVSFDIMWTLKGQSSKTKNLFQTCITFFLLQKKNALTASVNIMKVNGFQNNKILN